MAIEELLQRNRSTALSPLRSGPTPSMAVATVLCMDAPVDAHAAFGTTPGEAHLIPGEAHLIPDEAHLIRNAGRSRGFAFHVPYGPVEEVINH